MASFHDFEHMECMFGGHQALLARRQTLGDVAATVLPRVARRILNIALPRLFQRRQIHAVRSPIVTAQMHIALGSPEVDRMLIGLA